MPRRLLNIASIVFLVVPAQVVTGQVFYLEGQILAGQRGVELRPRPFFPYEHSPAAYSGTFTYEAGSSQATFELTFDTALGSGQTTDLFASTSFNGVVQNDLTTLAVDLTSPPEPWIISFALSLDKLTGQGQWNWSETQPQVCTPFSCAPGVPGSNALATITAFREVPEPGCWLLMGIAGFVLLKTGIRRRNG
jgi:hypothetical protein